MSHRPAVSLLIVALLIPALVPFAPSAAAVSGVPTYMTFDGPAGSSNFAVLAGFGGEPSLGVDWRTGEVLYQHGFDTFRVKLDANGAAHWLEVSAPNTPFNVDPMLYTDHVTGRTWAGGLNGPCSAMGITDDGGRSWTPAGNMCVPTLDHQTIASGPWALPIPEGVAYERATYYCAQASAVTCILSADGGLTWGASVPVSCRVQNPGFHGSVHVGPDGKVFLPFRNCGGGAGFSVSSDNGVTWTGRAAPGASWNGDGFDPELAVTPSGWVYFAYSNGEQGRSMAVLTKTNGTSWSTPVDIGASVGVLTSTFHEVVAGDDERAAVAFLGTTTPGDPYSAGFPGVWDLYVATTYDAGATWTTVKASRDPVQRGWMCDGGTGCSSGRNLLDFMDAQLDSQGRILVAYADGCIGACAGPSGTSATSTSSQATITRQSGGLTLLSAFDPSTGAFFVTGHGPYTATPGVGVALSGVAAAGVAPYTYSWSLLTQPEASVAPTFSSSTSASPLFTPDALGDYTLRLEARDASGALAVDLVRVTAIAATGVPLPACSTTVVTDAAADSTATGAGRGRRELVALHASDDAASWTLCAEVADMADAATTATKYAFFWEAPYEAPGIAYSATVTLSATGTISSAQFFKGVNAGVTGATFAQLGGPASAEVVGNTLRLTMAKVSIGAPQPGETATNLFARVENTVTPASTWDRAPQAAGAGFTFGATRPDAQPPTAVASLSATDATTGGVVDLAWSAASDDVGVQDYVVRRSTMPGGPYATVAITPSLGHQDGALTDGTAYYYVVAARDAAGGIGAFSPEASATPTGPGTPGEDATPPSVPTDLIATNVTAATVALAWTASADPESGIDHYEVLRDGAPVGETILPSFVDAGLESSTTYLYEVRAVNGDDLGGPVASLSVTTLARPADCGQVAAPYLLVADALGDSTRAGADGRADIVRVGVRETPVRLWFHIGVDDLMTSAPNTIFRIGFAVDDAHGFAVYVRATDTGAQPAGLFLTSAAGEVPLVKQPSVAFQCRSILVGVQKADLTGVPAGAILHDVRVTAQVDSAALATLGTPAPSATLDAAPDMGGADYTLGSAA